MQSEALNTCVDDCDNLPMEAYLYMDPSMSENKASFGICHSDKDSYLLRAPARHPVSTCRLVHMYLVSIHSYNM